MPEDKDMNLVRSRPTESGSGFAGAIIFLLIGYGIIDAELAPYWIAVMGALPGIITSVVEFFRRKK